MSRITTEYNGSINQRKCALTGVPFVHGDQITQYNQQEHETILRSIGLVDLTNYSGKNIGKWCLADVFLSRNKTRSGRTVKPVVRQADLTFVTGSGVAGCDTYDRCYDRGLDASYENGLGNDSKQLNRDLDRFIVDDNDEDALQTVDLDETTELECGSDWDSEESDEEEEEWEESEDEDEEL